MKYLMETIGYVAITAGFFAATKKEMTHFRIWHLVSSAFYIAYGLYLNSAPLVISAIVFCIIHIYHLMKQRSKKSHPEIHPENLVPVRKRVRVRRRSRKPFTPEKCTT